jgi:hypothetical protein
MKTFSNKVDPPLSVIPIRLLIYYINKFVTMVNGVVISVELEKRTKLKQISKELRKRLNWKKMRDSEY